MEKKVWTEEEIHNLVMEEVGSDEVYPCGAKVLLKLFLPPEKVGSLYRPETSVAQDMYNTCVGKILRMGPLADKDNFGNIGDWVTLKRYQVEEFYYDNVLLAVMYDDQARSKIADPNKYNSSKVLGKK
jgi:hypothetical protein